MSENIIEKEFRIIMTDLMAYIAKDQQSNSDFESTVKAICYRMAILSCQIEELKKHTHSQGDK